MTMKMIVLSADVQLFNKNFILTGAVGEKETVLRVKTRDFTSIIRQFVGDEAFFSMIEGILPEEVELSLIVPKEKENTFSVSADFAEKKVSVTIIKTGKYTLFSCWINNSIAFSHLPLVGEYIPAEHAISGIGFMYLKKKDKSIIIDPEDFSLSLLPQLGKMSSDDNRDFMLNEGENVFINYNVGKGETFLNYPENIQNSDSYNVNDSNEKNNQESKESVFRITEVGADTDFQNGNKSVLLKLSARLAISRFSFEVIGLNVGLNISHYLETIKEYSKQKNSDPLQLLAGFYKGTSFGIQGLALQYKSPAFSIYGGFYRENNAKSEEYNGLLTIKLQKIEIIALGSYVKQSTYSSLFAFGYLGLTIPLHPAFEIKGFALGLGLNREFKLPPISEIENFPLIQIVKNNGPRPGEGIKEIFSRLNHYIPPKEGAYVIMIGLRFQSFKIIDTIALIALNIENGLVFNMLGLSVMEVPEVYRIKFAFSLQADFNAGFVIARGEITNGSYLIFQEVKLQGSFVFAMWFSESLKGDFLFTIGGYHPNFNAPKHYPSSGELYRLGFSLRRGNLSAALQMYFALTPQAIMFGLIGRLNYTLDLSKSVTIDYWIGSKTFTFTIGVEVEIKLEAHFVMFWKPFSYRADLELLFNVRLYADFWFFTININVNLNARLSIWGPDLEGIAYLSVAGYSFTVKFGSSTSRSTQLTIHEFKKEFIPDDHLKLNISNGKISKETDKINNKETAIVNPKDFTLDFASQIPITSITLKDTKVIKGNSEFGVTYQRDNSKAFIHEITIEVLYMEGDVPKVQKGWDIEPVLQNMPKALWSQEPLTQNSVLSGDGLIKNLTAGAVIKFPEAKAVQIISGQKIENYDENLYTYFRKSTSRVQEFKKEKIRENNKNGSVFQNFGLNKDAFHSILDENDWDFTDLLSDEEMYSYSSDYEMITYSINI